MRRFAVAGLLLLLGACGTGPTVPLSGGGAGAPALPAPAELQAPYVGVLVGPLPHSGTVGSGVALDGRHVLTNAHVVRGSGGAMIRLRRTDGTAIPARVVAISSRMDLAVLATAQPHLVRPARFRTQRPAPGEAVWAAGTTLGGPVTARGHVRESETRLAGYGAGLSADIGAVMGYSGGPLADSRGAVVGLVTALRTVRAPGGLSTGGTVQGGRDIFVLGAREVTEEAGQLLAAASGS
jgi:S1-C subfamily serine protease